MNRKYTWIKQALDSRDYHLGQMAKVKKFSIVELPASASNIQWCPPVFDQSTLGSCTANAWGGLLGYNQLKDGLPLQDLSRLFIYYNERLIEGTVSEDSGANLRDGAKALATQGVCAETEWPYITEQFTVKPSDQCYTDALPNAIHSYYALNTLEDMKTCIANGQCFVFGFQVYESFESQEMASTGILNVPAANEQCLGGHAVMAIGYDDTQSRFIIRNSWGTGWGLPAPLSGYFSIGYDYITNPNLASDFWTVIRDI